MSNKSEGREKALRIEEEKKNQKGTAIINKEENR